MSSTKQKGGEAAEIRLLKRSKQTTKDGVVHTFHNLYLQINGGYPIAIDLPQKLFNRKVKNLLLAVASEYETAVVVKDDQPREKDF